jgi:hypothetical protein
MAHKALYRAGSPRVKAPAGWHADVWGPSATSPHRLLWIPGDSPSPSCPHRPRARGPPLCHLDQTKPSSPTTTSRCP